jgi:hypothetical protein
VTDLEDPEQTQTPPEEATPDAGVNDGSQATDPPADEPPQADLPPDKPPKGGIEPMAKSTVGVVDFNTRDTVERSKYLPGCDIVASLNATSGKSISDAAAIVASSVALGAPFAYVIVGNKLWIDATDKTKTPYSALQTAVGA